MARTRKNKEDAWMPPRVYRGRSAFEFKPVSGGCVRLCPLNSAKSLVMKKYEEIVEINQHNNVTKLFKQFYASAEFNEKARNTREGYELYKKDLLAAFGKMDVNKVQPKHVRMFMDKKAVKSGIVQANRHKSALQVVFAWAYERGKIKINPCIGVKKFKERARTRYITDTEYQALLDAACPVVFAAAEISYLCMARKGDVLTLKRNQLAKDGIYIKQGKTGKQQIKAWSTRLHAAIDSANQIRSNVISLFVIHQRGGSKYTAGGFRGRWVTAMQKARKATGFAMDFTFHDIKAKGISDFIGSLEDKREAAGHTTTKQTADYDRKVHVVKTLGSE